MSTHSDSLPGFFRRRPTGETDNQAEHGDTMSTTGGGSSQEPVVVWEAANNLEAQIVKGRLESEGIPAIIRGEAIGSIYGLTTGSLAATDVLVPAPLADQALDILNSAVEWDEDAFDDEEGAVDDPDVVDAPSRDDSELE